MRSHLYYVLGGEDGRTPVQEPDFLKWAQMFERTELRRVAFTELPNEHGFISTVFLGLDHGFSDDAPPMLFETMSHLGGEWEDYFARYHTWAEAEAGHAAIVTEAFEALEHAHAAIAEALTPKEAT